MSKDNIDNYIKGLKKIAYERLHSNQVEVTLINWWTNKYNLPPTDNRLLKYTIEELFVEYFEDLLRLKNSGEKVMTEEEIEKMRKEDEMIPDINPALQKKSVDISAFQVNKNKSNE